MGAELQAKSWSDQEAFATSARTGAGVQRLKRHGCAKAIIIDGLRSYKATKNLGVAEREEVSRWANNMAGTSHQPYRRRERTMLRFKRVKTR